MTRVSLPPLLLQVHLLDNTCWMADWEWETLAVAVVASAH
jgi:hypothetical protein